MSTPPETNIRNKKLRGVLWNWKPVADMMPGKMGVSDIDGVVERNGHFLFMESKNEREPLSVGQRIMLVELAKLNPERVRVVIVYGDRTTGEILGYCRVTADGVQERASPQAFKVAFTKWFNHADSCRRH
jgi:hypothetical protein